MAKVHSVEVMGIAGRGATKAAARADALAEIQRILDADRQYPRVETLRGHAALIFPTSGQWAYRLISKPGEGPAAGDVLPTCTGGWSRLEAIAYARAHLAQNAWSQAVEDDEAFIAEAFPCVIPGKDTLGNRQAADLRMIIGHWRQEQEARAA